MERILTEKVFAPPISNPLSPIPNPLSPTIEVFASLFEKNDRRDEHALVGFSFVKNHTKQFPVFFAAAARMIVLNSYRRKNKNAPFSNACRNCERLKTAALL
ncbi:MAG: hypothetical protein IJW46_00365 [Clostridia bacterium]|nr:hypothetical protein [Clostridia bacterium]